MISTTNNITIFVEQKTEKNILIKEMSKLQREEDEMYEVTYLIEILPDCRTCKDHHGQTYGSFELVCAVHPYGYTGDSCPDYQAKKG